MLTPVTPALTLIGFGEAAQALVQGWTREGSWDIRAYDVKTVAGPAPVQQRKWEDYARCKVSGCATLMEALVDAEQVFCLVTADQALAAAQQAADAIAPGSFYFDCNSCSPGTKRQAAEVLTRAGAHYVDVAVMAPVHPSLHRVPLLLSGPHAVSARAVLAGLDMNAKVVEGPLGSAAATKMVRSIMVKGLEALIAECVLAGYRSGVDAAVLASLEQTFPGFAWPQRAAYMLERVVTHGVRRAAEMREVAKTVEETGLPAPMATASADWQQRIGELGLSAADDGDYRDHAKAILAALLPEAGPKQGITA